jgi:hypothetical protein
LFPEIYEFLNANGFILRDVRIAFPFDYEVIELEVFFSRDPRNLRGGNLASILRIWELFHDIPPGRTLTFKDNQITWLTLPI